VSACQNALVPVVESPLETTHTLPLGSPDRAGTITVSGEVPVPATAEALPDFVMR
jgi:hypothetical protein